jgi:hypothetical protein
MPQSGSKGDENGLAVGHTGKGAGVKQAVKRTVPNSPYMKLTGVRPAAMSVALSQPGWETSTQGKLVSLDPHPAPVPNGRVSM